MRPQCVLQVASYQAGTPNERREFDSDSCGLLAPLFTVVRTRFVVLTDSASPYSRGIHGRGITGDSTFLKLKLSTIGEFMAAMASSSVIVGAASGVRLANPRT